MPKNLKPPSENPGGNPPAGKLPTKPASGKVVCCTCSVEGKVVTNDSMYNRATYWPNGTVNKCSIKIERNNSGGKVTITKSFYLGYELGATKEKHEKLAQGLIDTAMKKWTGYARKFKVHLQQPGCPLQKLAIEFKAEHKATKENSDVVVVLYDADNVSQVTGGTKMDFYLKDENPTWTMMHEIGHTFGLMDEYHEFAKDEKPSSPPILTVLGSRPQADAVIALSTSGQEGRSDKEGRSTIIYDVNTGMGKGHSEIFLDYHFYWIAIEVKRKMPSGTIVQIL